MTPDRLTHIRKDLDPKFGDIMQSGINETVLDQEGVLNRGRNRMRYFKAVVAAAAAAVVVAAAAVAAVAAVIVVISLIKNP